MWGRKKEKIETAEEIEAGELSKELEESRTRSEALRAEFSQIRNDIVALGGTPAGNAESAQPAKPEEEIYAYCHICGKTLTRDSVRWADGTTYCEEHLPAVPPAQPPVPPLAQPGASTTTPPPAPGTPATATPVNTAPETAPIQKTPEEAANDKAREEYFDSMRELHKKRPKEGTPESIQLSENFREKEAVYKGTKNKVVGRFLNEGKTDEYREFLLKEAELTRKEKVKSNFVGAGEHIVANISAGIEKWDNWGKAGWKWEGKWKGLGNGENWKGLGARFTKTSISLAMIAAISGGSVEKLANMGIGTASALGGGLTSFFGRRMTMGLGMSAVMAVTSEKKKKWVQATLMAGMVGATVVVGSGVGMAVSGIVISSIVGLGLARLTKKYDTNIEGILKKAQEGEINIATLEEDVAKMEKEIEKAQKEIYWARIKGKVKEAGTALAGSMASLELMGAAHNYHETQKENVDLKTHHDSDVARHNADARHIARLEEQHRIDAQHEADARAQHDADTKALEDAKNNPAPAGQQTAPNPETSAPASPTAPTPETATGHETQITFEHGKGSIQGILDLKAELRHQYPDVSKAPESVQEFLKTDATKEAMRLGLFRPGDTNESAMVGQGSVLKFDGHGNLSLHDTLTGKDSTLIHGDNSVDQYGGKMFHSGHHAEHAKVPEIEEKTFVTMGKTDYSKLPIGPGLFEGDHAHMTGSHGLHGEYLAEAPTGAEGEVAHDPAIYPTSHSQDTGHWIKFGQHPVEQAGIHTPHHPAEQINLHVPPEQIERGAENYFFQQILHDQKFAHDVGFKDGMNIDEFAKHQAHILAIKGGYIPADVGHGVKGMAVENHPAPGHSTDHKTESHVEAYKGRFFKDISPTDNRMLHERPEFFNNHFHLSGTQLKEALHVHDKNIAHIFSHHDRGTDAWEGHMKNMKADEILSGPEHKNPNDLLATYMHRLKDMTHLNPQHKILGFGKNETANEYIARCLQWMESKKVPLLKM